MAYEVNFTDSINKGSITVEDNSLNTETSLGLPGRNLSDYGQNILENFLHLLENFANNTSPQNPVEGQLWYDTTTGVDQLKVYDGAAWVSAGGLKKGSSQPESTSSTIGDLWVDTSNQQVYLYTGSGWILVGPEYAAGASTGSKFENIISTTNQEVPVIINYVNNIPVSIISGTAFTPKLTIAGFSSIRVGTNLSTNISGSAAKYYGTSEKAENLIVNNATIPGNQFARLNVQNNFLYPIRISNNSGIGIGETETLSLSVTSSNALITNRSTDGYIAFRVNNNTTAIRITNEGNIGIKNENPQEALDVTGNLKLTGTIKSTDTTNSTSFSTGALVVSGGAGIAKKLYVGDSATIAGDLEARSIIPDTNLTRNLGAPAYRYNNVYGNNFYGTFRGDLIGNISGAAATASRLNSTTSFTITGDMTSTAPVTFDGQTGGLTKTFNVTLDTSLFTGKDSYTDNISGSEEVLIRKTALESGDTQSINTFYTTTVADIAATVPTFAVGMVMPYAGTTAPTGWRMCNGDAISVADTNYEPLYLVIGFTYGGSLGSGYFYLPDLRGRFPLGYLDGETRTLATDEDRVYDDGAADILGGSGGTNRKWIKDDNLPEHTHDLMGDAGTQFYAVTNVTGGTDSNSVGISITGGVPGTGLTETEGVVGLTTTTETIDGVPEQVGEKFETVPPFLALNYIIYTGV